MNTAPTTGELKVKMDSMCDSMEQLKISVNEGFADLKRELQQNYVRNETFQPVQRFVTGIQYIGTLLIIGLIGLLMAHIIPGFKL